MLDAGPDAGRHRVSPLNPGMHGLSQWFWGYLLPPGQEACRAALYNDIACRLMPPSVRVGLPRFEAQASLPIRDADGTKISYDRHVVEYGRIPTRDGNLHDYYNFFTWLRFPRAKLALHRLQFLLQSERRRSGGNGNRTGLEDRLTLLDEGGVLILHDPAARSEMQSFPPRLHVFGHGVLEQLYAGRSDFSGFGVIMLFPDPPFDDPKRTSPRDGVEAVVDDALAFLIESGGIFTAATQAVPMVGWAGLFYQTAGG